jgi:hypothetical protein
MHSMPKSLRATNEVQVYACDDDDVCMFCISRWQHFYLMYNLANPALAVCAVCVSAMGRQYCLVLCACDAVCDRSVPLGSLDVLLLLVLLLVLGYRACACGRLGSGVGGRVWLGIFVVGVVCGGGCRRGGGGCIGCAVERALQRLRDGVEVHALGLLLR